MSDNHWTAAISMSTHPSQLSILELLTISVDPSARKHKVSPTSVEAHEKVRPSKEHVYKRIMGLLNARAEFGATSKEIAAAFGVQLNCLSGRCSELKTMGWIKENGQRRDGAAVLIIS